MGWDHGWLLSVVLGYKVQVVVAGIRGLRRFETRNAFDVFWNVILHIASVSKDTTLSRYSTSMQRKKTLIWRVICPSGKLSKLNKTEMIHSRKV